MPIPVLATIVAATVAVAILLRCARWLPQAQPGSRSLHAKPLSRVGGLAIAAGIAAGVPGWGPLAGVASESAWIFAVASLAVAAVSLVDDWRGTGAAARLAVHGCAALAVASTFPLDPVSIAATTVAIVWMANLFNFMDGNDGLAAIAAVCGFAAYAAAANASGANAVPYACIALAALPFLVVNLPPARIFMGDVGAVTLGFAAATLGIAGVVGGAWPAWLPPLAFVTLICDATATLVARALRGERVWQAHKLHYYQRVNQMGAGHRGTLALYAALSAGSAATAIACIVASPRSGWLALAAWIALIALLFATIDYHWRRRTIR